MPTQDWRFSWMITAQQNNPSNGASFDGNIVVFENRPFAVDPRRTGQAAGETVVEGVFGFSSKVLPMGGPGYGCRCRPDRLIRWYGIPDRPRRQGRRLDRRRDLRAKPASRHKPFLSPRGAQPPEQRRVGQPAGAAVLLVPGSESDSGGPIRTPTWRAAPTAPWSSTSTGKLDARTLAAKRWLRHTRFTMNAVLVCPYVVNVIPQMFFVR